ncbi:lipocalin family protein [Sphingobacterium sp. SYP-B4668]|uniref:lipocalin family protein n=1 Tax=Sphingobacterium sp. SYP-B4668 TaxID=2996035 RepID=UPI0022DD6417|nr:lipocalin family protein [Sphingobacterium sp. SYP-B4668]
MNKKKSLILLSAAAVGTFLYKALKPVKSNIKGIPNFKINSYLGTWYEIARMDFRWEKNLKNVTAHYSLRDDGSIEVTNSGYDVKQEKEKTTIGNAIFMREHTEGALKVTFFRPFSSGYYVMKIDEDYRYALVFGDNLDYMWILSREKSIPGDIRAEYLDFALRSGFEIHKLVWTIQD